MFELTSAIQLSPNELKLVDGTPILHGMVIDEFISSSSRIIRDESGRYVVEETGPIVSTRYDYFWLAVPALSSALGLVLIKAKESRSFAFRILSLALGRVEGIVDGITFDVYRLGQDYPGHWLGGIERLGRWQRGTLWGDGLEEDDIVGEEYTKCVKNQVGFWTSYFGAPTKVKVTGLGGVMVLRDLRRCMNEFVQYIKDELLGYAIQTIP